jgi:hypothetical protein
MPVKSSDTRILIDEFDFSTDTKSVKMTRGVKVITRNALQTPAAISIPGTVSGSIAQNGYWVGVDAGTIEKEIDDRLGTEDPCIVSVIFDTTAQGNPAYTLETAWADQMEVDAPLDDLLTIVANWSGDMRRGLSTVHATVSATGGQGVIDFGAAGTNGGWYALHVRAIEGTADDATFTVQSSTSVGFSGPTTHATITLSAVGAQLTTFTGNVGRYVRINCTALGGADSISVTGIVGVSGVTGQ